MTLYPNATHLDSSVEIEANRGYATADIEVASRAVGDAGASAPHQLDFVLAEVTCVSEDRVVS